MSDRFIVVDGTKIVDTVGVPIRLATGRRDLDGMRELETHRRRMTIAEAASEQIAAAIAAMLSERPEVFDGPFGARREAQG